MADTPVAHNVRDIDDANGPVGTTAEGATGKSRMWVEGDGGNSSDAPGCPVYSPKYRFEFDDTDLSLTGTYQDAFNETGSGKLVGFILHFDNNDVAVKLTIDSTEVIFDIEYGQLVAIQSDGPGSSGLGIRSSAGGPFVDNVENKVVFYPECAIPYASAIKVEVKETTGGAPKKLVDRCITLTRES